jgi:hypothetical protein
MTAVVTATLKAGAEPATPITADSRVPKEPPAKPFSCDMLRPSEYVESEVYFFSG